MRQKLSRHRIYAWNAPWWRNRDYEWWDRGGYYHRQHLLLYQWCQGRECQHHFRDGRVQKDRSVKGFDCNRMSCTALQGRDQDRDPGGGCYTWNQFLRGYRKSCTWGAWRYFLWEFQNIGGTAVYPYKAKRDNRWSFRIFKDRRGL